MDCGSVIRIYDDPGYWRHRPVSYTHLDVYKRQEFNRPEFLEGNSAEEIHERMMNNLPDDIDDMPGGFPYGGLLMMNGISSTDLPSL